MKPVDSLIFDLDGTLWDTCASCAVAWNEVLNSNNISFRPITADDVRGVAGRPHEECVRTVFRGLPERSLQLLVRETMEADNQMIARLGGHVYAGVKEGLAVLSLRFPLYIVSNCQTGYIEMFLRLADVAGLFADFECWGNTGNAKADNIVALIKRNRLSHPMVIGDTDGDRKAAALCGLPFVHVEYGFGKCAGPDASVASFSELVEFALELPEPA